MNLFLAIGYVMVAFLLFNRSTNSRHTPMHRLVNVLLAGSVFCFGIGQWLLLTTGNNREWLFDSGHVLFFLFASVYLWHGESPVIRYNERAKRR